MDTIVDDCLEIIVKNMDYKTLINFQQTSAYYFEFIKKREEDIYRNLLEKDFGVNYKNSKKTYLQLKKIDLNGKWLVENWLYFENSTIKQNYTTIIRSNGKTFTAEGMMDENVEFKINGNIDGIKIGGDVEFFEETKPLGVSTFSGQINLEKYLRSTVLQIETTYKYEYDGICCNGKTIANKCV